MTASAPCALIPTYNHVDALDSILRRLISAALPVIVVDDGSSPAIAGRIAELCRVYSDVELLRHHVNGGKGAAVVSGLARAAERGFTHAVQIDADGQHDLAALADLVHAAQKNPTALVLGRPLYDETIPRGRRIGRGLTRFWVGVNTLSSGISDTMCGFRVYPVAPAEALARDQVRGRRMDFDVEMVVRWVWQGLPIVGVPVNVRYPPHNTSNFRMLRDNALISAMHTRLFFGMLVRWPKLARRQVTATAGAPDATHWAGLAERGAFWGLQSLAFTYRVLGPRACRALLYPVVLYFFVTGREQRRASLAYLRHARNSGILDHEPTLATSLEHFQTFGRAAVDKFAAWTGRIPLGKIDDASEGLLAAAESNPRGAFVITAHLGNAEVLRATADLRDRARVNVLVHTVHARRFNELIARVSPRSRVRALQVTEIGPETVILLGDAIERGEWVVMAGDRVAVGETGERVVHVPFLGRPAPFPQGPIILASLLRCPVYMMVCLRDGERFRIHFEHLAEQVVLPRRNRNEAIVAYVTTFVRALERHVARAPLQWFNFYDFWCPPGARPRLDGIRDGQSRMPADKASCAQARETSCQHADKTSSMQADKTSSMQADETSCA